MIEEGARNALRDLPATIRIEVNSVDKLADFKGRAGVEITGPLEVESRAEDWMRAWNQF